jgi:chemosensory pili system protein ChpC
VSEIDKPAPEHDVQGTVRCLVIPLEGTALLIPNALVSEVAPFQSPVPMNGPQWLLGQIQWRGLSVPLISIEAMAGMPKGQPERMSRAIVFNTLNGNQHMPFIAVASRGIPRMLGVAPEMLPPGCASAPEGVLCRFEYNGETMMIPDLDRIERWLLDGGIVVQRADMTEKV